MLHITLGYCPCTATSRLGGAFIETVRLRAETEYGFVTDATATRYIPSLIETKVINIGYQSGIRCTYSGRGQNTSRNATKITRQDRIGPLEFASVSEPKSSQIPACLGQPRLRSRLKRDRCRGYITRQLSNKERSEMGEPTLRLLLARQRVSELALHGQQLTLQWA
jgi:hypothetical protein